MNTQNNTEVKYNFNEGSECFNCLKRECTCPERQFDGSWVEKPQEESWIKEFEEGIPKTDNTLLDSKSYSGDYRFGYKYQEGDTIHCVTDWENIKSFIHKTREEAKEEGYKLAIEDVRQGQLNK